MIILWSDYGAIFQSQRHAFPGTSGMAACARAVVARRGMPSISICPELFKFWAKDIRGIDTAHAALCAAACRPAAGIVSTVVIQEWSYGRRAGVDFKLRARRSESLSRAAQALSAQVGATFYVLRTRVESSRDEGLRGNLPVVHHVEDQEDLQGQGHDSVL